NPVRTCGQLHSIHLTKTCTFAAYCARGLKPIPLIPRLLIVVEVDDNLDALAF
ncbi:18459_t:CDS:1, partial [Gigaspora rosea]